MPYKLTIELSNRDLRHFRRELKRAREAVGIADDEEILAAASELVGSLRRRDLPTSSPSGSASSRRCSR